MKVSKSTKVVMYRAVDGSLHESEELCEIQNARLFIGPTVKELFEKQFAMPEDDSELAFSMNDITQFVSENTDALFAILLPLQPKKERVSRKAKDALPPAPPAATAPAAPAPTSDLKTDAGEPEADLVKISDPGAEPRKAIPEAV